MNNNNNPRIKWERFCFSSIDFPLEKLYNANVGTENAGKNKYFLK